MDSHKHLLLAPKKLIKCLLGGQPVLETLLTVSPVNEGLLLRGLNHTGAGEMDSKIISEPRGNVLHNTCLTCHASPVCDENSSLIYSVLERCGQAFASQNNAPKGTVCLLAVGSAASGSPGAPRRERLPGRARCQEHQAGGA